MFRYRIVLAGFILVLVSFKSCSCLIGHLKRRLHSTGLRTVEDRMIQTFD